MRSIIEAGFIIKSILSLEIGLYMVYPVFTYIIVALWVGAPWFFVRWCVTTAYYYTVDAHHKHSTFGKGGKVFLPPFKFPPIKRCQHIILCTDTGDFIEQSLHHLLSQGRHQGILHSKQFLTFLFFEIMRALSLLILLVGSITAEDVLDLGDSNFKDAVANEDIMLVEFFAPW